MKWNKVFLAALLSLSLAIISCDESDVGNPPNNGTVDATMYVAIGNSLTAGYASGSMYESAQKYSYPKLIAEQVGTSNFVQPMFPEAGTGSKIVLKSLNPVTISADPIANNPPTNLTYPAPYNNLGIPGAILYDAVDTSSALSRAVSRSNPFYPYVMRDQNVFGKTLVDQASKLRPTLITFWLGNNDVLGYATSGGVKGTNLGLDGKPQFTLPTEVFWFERTLDTALARLRRSNPNATILIANIPDVTSVPFFTTVPIKIPNPTNPTQLLSIYYKNNKAEVKAATTGDYVLLTAQTELGKGVGLMPTNPLASNYVLDAEEATIAKNAVSEFNQKIFTLAAKHKAKLVNVNARMAEIKAGIKIAGESFNAGFITGGVFSLDGVHPSAKGQGIIANEFIKVMNDQFGANIAYVNIASLPGLAAPSNKAGAPAKYPSELYITPHVFDFTISLFAR